MALLTIRLLTDDGSRVEAISYEIPDDEWQRLQRFHGEVERLRSTKFVQNSRGGQIAIKWEAGSHLKSNANPVDTDEAGAMLLKLRPFVLNDEECYFHRVKKLLKRRLEHDAFRRCLDLLNDRFTLKALQRRVDLSFSGRKMLSVDTVMDWLNSYEYHRNPDKKELVQSDLGFLADDQDGLPVVLFALVEMVQAILDLDGLVETLIQVESGSRSEVRYPVAWASGT